MRSSLCYKLKLWYTEWATLTLWGSNVHSNWLAQKTKQKKATCEQRVALMCNADNFCVCKVMKVLWDMSLEDSRATTYYYNHLLIWLSLTEKCQRNKNVKQNLEKQLDIRHLTLLCLIRNAKVKRCMAMWWKPVPYVSNNSKFYLICFVLLWLMWSNRETIKVFQIKAAEKDATLFLFISGLMKGLWSSVYPLLLPFPLED